MSFEDLNLIEPISKALAALKYEKPTPIQTKAIPIVLKKRDVLGSAQTGTGKTAAFAIPTIQLLHEPHGAPKKGPIRALVLVPTRELAMQVSDSFADYARYAGVTMAAVFGGVPQRQQTRQLKARVDVLVATPGRLIDLCNQKIIDLSMVEILILDEADRMLDMGFVDDIEKIIAKTPDDRQTLFFSATMPKSVASLTKKILNDPVRVAIAGKSAADTVEQHVYFVDGRDKPNLLVHLLKSGDVGSALIFGRTKAGVENLTKYLRKTGIRAEAIHGDKSQRERQRALQKFKDGKCKILVGTDVAARGIDVDGLTHVINYELPETSEDYVHRIGRTGRAGAKGIAISFCNTYEHRDLWRIQTDTKNVLAVVDHPFALNPEPFALPPSRGAKGRSRGYKGKSKPGENRRGRAGSKAPSRDNRIKRNWDDKPSKPKGKGYQASAPKKPRKGKWDEDQSAPAANTGSNNGSNTSNSGDAKNHKNDGPKRSFKKKDSDKPKSDYKKPNSDQPKRAFKKNDAGKPSGGFKKQDSERVKREKNNNFGPKPKRDFAKDAAPKAPKKPSQDPRIKRGWEDAKTDKPKKKKDKSDGEKKKDGAKKPDLKKTSNTSEAKKGAPKKTKAAKEAAKSKGKPGTHKKKSQKGPSETKANKKTKKAKKTKASGKRRPKNKKDAK